MFMRCHTSSMPGVETAVGALLYALTAGDGELAGTAQHLVQFAAPRAVARLALQGLPLQHAAEEPGAERAEWDVDGDDDGDQERRAVGAGGEGERVADRRAERVARGSARVGEPAFQERHLDRAGDDGGRDEVDRRHRAPDAHGEADDAAEHGVGALVDALVDVVGHAADGVGARVAVRHQTHDDVVAAQHRGGEAGPASSRAPCGATWRRRSGGNRWRRAGEVDPREGGDGGR